LPVTRYALFSKMCSPAPGTTHPPTQGLLKDLPPHIKQLKHAVDHSLPYSAKLKKWNSHLAFSFMVLINTPLHAWMSYITCRHIKSTNKFNFK